MGNACCGGRNSSYTVVRGDETAQETSFNTGSVTVQAEQSEHNHSQLLHDHAKQQPHQAMTSNEETYDKAMDNLPLQRSDSLEHLLTCCICLDFLYEPVRSPCNHSFCMLCLKRLLEYDGQRASCPKCRRPFSGLNPDSLTIDEPLQRTVQLNYEQEEVDKRMEEASLDEKEYKDARADRERKEYLMQHNPLQLMFENESDFARRRILRRDLALFEGMGFSRIMSQKALFVSSGTHTEALSWLVMHQHHPDANLPWNSTQLQEQVALRGTRRSLCEVVLPPETRVLIPGKLSIDVSVVKHSSILGYRAWMVVSKGFTALGCPEIVFLLRVFDQERQLPPHLVFFLKSIFIQVENGTTSVNHASVFEFAHSAEPFLNNPEITGIMLTRPKGQSLVYLQLPTTNILFGLILVAQETELAKVNPTRLLLQIGRQHRMSHPFPLFNDRTRQSCVVDTDIPVAGIMSKAMFIRDSLSMRVKGASVISRPFRFLPFLRKRTEQMWLLLNLPIEAATDVKEYVRSWPSTATVLPFITDFPIGCDGYLLSSGLYSSPRMHSLEGAIGVAVAGVSVAIVSHEGRYGTGGIIGSDGFVFHCQPDIFADIRKQLMRGEDIEIPARSSTLGYGLKIKWFPAQQIRAGFSHISPEVFPNNNVPEYNYKVGNVCDGVILPLLASESQELKVPVLHPRIRVMGVGLGRHMNEMSAVVDDDALQEYILEMNLKIVDMLKNLLIKYNASATPSLITVHIKLYINSEDKIKAEYRISKNFARKCPQAPSLNMDNWSKVLHSASPPLVNDELSLQIAFKVK
eukprot:m.79754 g.79754  ORF g.79754 m.79754 type:complete len:802 (-) comp8615_c1_seq1:248-2653(-)